MTKETINADVTMGGAVNALLAGRYRIVRQLGQGGMGSVWLAEDTELDNRQVAVKVLPSVLLSNKRAYNQIKAEALVSLKLTHPNIATLRSFEENNGNPFLVIDYIDGQTLDDYLADKGKLGEEETINLLKPIAAALDYAHSKGVVHRDIKPGNIVIAKNGTPYILDFGIAREMQETMTRVTGKLSSGTLMYMSPEQLNGDPPKAAQDVYSFAALVYECLTGAPPFVRGGIEDQIKNKVPDPIDPIIGIGGSVMAGLEKAAKLRPETCEDVLEVRAPRKDASLIHPLECGMPSPECSKGSTDRSQYTGKVKRRAIVCVVWLIALQIVGLVISFVIWRITPKMYEATSEFTIQGRQIAPGAEDPGLEQSKPGGGDDCRVIFSDRIPDWRSEKMGVKVIERYRADHSGVTASDEDVLSALSGSEINLVRNSRTVAIKIRSKVPALAAALANAYAESIEAAIDEENKLRCDKAVSQIHDNVEKQRRIVDKVSKQLLDFRTVNKVENLRSSRDTIQQGLSKTTGEILGLETEEAQLVEWEKLLVAVQKDPMSYGTLSSAVPRAKEIADEFNTYQESESNSQKLMLNFTANHPEVVSAKKSAGLARQHFLDAVARSLLVGRSSLQVARNQLGDKKKKQEELRKELDSVEQRIVLAESGVAQLEAEIGVGNRVLEGLILDENKIRNNIMSNNEVVRICRPARMSGESVSPRPRMIFSICSLLALFLGVAFAFVTGKNSRDVSRAKENW